MMRAAALVWLLLCAGGAWGADFKLEARAYDMVRVRGADEPYEGTIKEENETQVRFVTVKGIGYTWPRSQVTEIQRKCTLEEAYERASASAGGDPRAHLRLYEACVEAKLPDQAIAELQKAIRADPKYVPAYQKLLEGARAAKNVDLELGTLEAAGRAGVATVAMLSRQAEVYARLGLIENADETLGKILALDAFNFRAQGKRAMIALARGRPDAAGKLIDEMLRRDAGNVHALVALGELEMARDRLDKAADAFSKALAQSKSAVAAAGLGSIRLREGKFDEAERQYELARMLRGDLAEAAAGQAVAAARRGKLREAEQLIGAAAAAHPRNVSVLLARGYAAELGGKTSEALKAYQAVLEAGGANVHALTGAGRACLRLGDGAKAGEYFRQALALRPSFPAAMRGLGHVKLEENPAEAAGWFRKVTESGAATAADRAALGAALIRLRQFGDAAAELEKAGPDNVDAHVALGFVAHTLGNEDEALGHFEAAVKLGDRGGYAAEAVRRIRLGGSRAFWLDEFRRPGSATVGNGWAEVEPQGASVFVSGNALVADGQPGADDAVVRLVRQEGVGFVSIVAEVSGGTVDGLVGVFVGVQGKPAEVRFGRDAGGNAAVLLPGAAKAKAYSRPMGERFTVGLEIVDAVQGTVRVLVDGQQVPGAEDIAVRDAAGATGYEVGLFVQPARGKNVRCTFHNVTIVRLK